MRTVLESIEAEFRRYRILAEKAMDQLDDDQLAAATGANSVATIAWHLGSNLRSRFTDFLTTDGEKPWRDRESEFLARNDADTLRERWNEGWEILEASLGALDDGDLATEVTIRRQPLTVLEALLRSVAHAAYHVGQIVHLARAAKGDDWEFLSIPPGGTEAYDRNPTMEKAPEPT